MSEQIQKLKEVSLQYNDYIFFVIGILRKNQIDLKEQEENFIKYCFFMYNRNNGDYDEDYKNGFSVFPNNIIENFDEDNFYNLYKNIEGSYETMITKFHHENLEYPKLYSDLFNDPNHDNIFTLYNIKFR